MNTSITKTIHENALLFEQHIKPELSRDWGGDIISIESQTDSELAALFDRGASSDVILNYVQTKGPMLTVASRMEIAPENQKQHCFSAWDLNYTLRCSYVDSKGGIGLDCELAKLLKAAHCQHHGRQKGGRSTPVRLKPLEFQLDRNIN